MVVGPEAGFCPLRRNKFYGKGGELKMDKSDEINPEGECVAPYLKNRKFDPYIGHVLGSPGGSVSTLLVHTEE